MRAVVITKHGDLSVLKVRPRVVAAAIYTRDGELFANYAKPGAAKTSLPAKPEGDGYRIEGDYLVIFRRVAEKWQAPGL